MGVQTELNKIRKQTGETQVNEEPVDNSGPVTNALDSVMTAVETTVGEFVGGMIPTAEMVEAILPTQLAVPEIDLSLPT